MGQQTGRFRACRCTPASGWGSAGLRLDRRACSAVTVRSCYEKVEGFKGGGGGGEGGAQKKRNKRRTTNAGRYKERKGSDIPETYPKKP